MSIAEEILQKVSSYNLFTNLVPGVVYCVACKQILSIDIAGSDPVAAFFVYYFVGMVLNRVGSLVVEPVFQYLKIVHFAPYADFLAAEGKDPKIQDLLTVANTYRTAIGSVLAFVFVWVGSWLVNSGTLPDGSFLAVVVALVLALFVFGYRKQITYIRKRIEKRVSENAGS